MRRIIIAAIATLISTTSFAHEHGRTDQYWASLSQEEKDWYATLKQPDVPSVSCCGESDQYWCDKISVKDGKTFCTITDDRPDEQFKRPHIPMGTMIEIPNNKLKWDRGNPTGHAIVFLRTHDQFVYCFVQGTGI